MNVLVVEDHPAMRRVVELVLGEVGATGEVVGTREPLALPQRRDRVLVDVEALVALAQHEGCPVGARERTRGAADDRLDLLERAGERQPLDRLREHRHRVCGCLCRVAPNRPHRLRC